MSNNKPTAVATIKFYPNKHIEIELTSIEGITPRTLAIAENLLGRKYRGMKGQYIAESHKRAREATAAKEKADAAAEIAYHIKRDEELAAAAVAVEVPQEAEEKPDDTTETSEPVPEEGEGESAEETVAEDESSEEVIEAANDDEADTGDEPKVA